MLQWTIICYTKFRNIYLWNPTIRKLKVLPNSGLYDDERVAYGFWFDMNTEDYKVAKISCMEKSKIELYNLNSNSWDVFTTSGPNGPNPNASIDNVVHVNVTLYWLICRNGDWKIISFDTKNGMSQETLIWARSAEWLHSQSEIALLAAGDNSHFFFVLRFTYMKCRNVWVYDVSLNKPYMTDFKVRIERQHPIGIRNNSREVLFQK